MKTETKFIWKKAQSYESQWDMQDDKMGLNVGCSFVPNGQYDLYQPLLAAQQAPYELGYVAYSIRHRHLGLQTDKTKKMWSIDIDNQRPFSVGDALSMKKPSTREMLGCAKSISSQPQNGSQRRRRAINELLVRRIQRWIIDYGLLSNKSTIYLDEWTTTSLEFEWIFTYSSLMQNLVNDRNLSSDQEVLFREGVEENIYSVMKLGEATDLINSLIGKRLKLHTESYYNNFEYSLMPNSLTGALWMIVANHLKNKIFFTPCINQFTPCLRFLADTRPGRRGHAACSNKCKQRAFYWKSKNKLVKSSIFTNDLLIIKNALSNKDMRLSDPFGQIKSMK